MYLLKKSSENHHFNHQNISLLVILIIISLCYFLIPTVPVTATPFHQITIDGDLGDFTSDELIIDDPIADTSNHGGDIINVTIAWDATNVFFGIEGPIVSGSAGITRHTLFIALDTGAGGGTRLPWDRNVNFTGATRPNYVICLGYDYPTNPGGPFSQLHNQSSIDPNNFTWKEDLTTNYLAWDNTHLFTEVAIPLASINNPSSFYYSIIVSGDDFYRSAIDVFPNDSGLKTWYNDNDYISTYASYNFAGSAHTVTFTGDKSDFYENETYSDSGELGDTIAVNADLDCVYCTWNATHVFLGVNGTDPTNLVYDIDLFVALDFRVGGGTSAVWSKDVTFGGFFLPDYVIAIEDGSIHQVLNWTGSAWQDIEGSLTDYSIYVAFNTEIQFLKDDLNNCTEMNISVFIAGGSNGDSAFDVAPDDNGVGPRYTDIDVISSGFLITHLNVSGWKPCDPLPPVISDVSNFNVEQDTPNVNIKWTLSEQFPDTILLYINDVPSPIPYNDTIKVAVLTSTVQILNYSLWINDTNGEFAFDEVIVTIMEKEDEGDDDTDKAPPIIPGYNLFFLIGVICVITIILIKKRVKNRN